ncbi:MAG: DUF5786 family protein [Halobacteriota archaeon]
MGMGAYDESEHERREGTREVDDSEAMEKTEYDGEVSYDTPDVEDLLDNYEG